MKLYALCDQDMLDLYAISIEKYIDLAKSKGAEIIQYRNKNANMAFIKEQLLLIRKSYNGCLIVNDAYELVEFCDGVHLGQEDLHLIDKDSVKAVEFLRNIITKEKILGISTHNEDEVIEANLLDINYIGLGAYRETSTKKDISSVLGSKIDTIALKSKHPVAVIGGVKLDDVFENIEYHVIGSGLLK